MILLRGASAVVVAVIQVAAIGGEGGWRGGGVVRLVDGRSSGSSRSNSIQISFRSLRKRKTQIIHCNCIKIIALNYVLGMIISDTGKVMTPIEPRMSYQRQYHKFCVKQGDIAHPSPRFAQTRAHLSQEASYLHKVS